MPFDESGRPRRLISMLVPDPSFFTSSETPMPAAEKTAAPAIDLQTFDMGWNAAIERAAETAKCAAGLVKEGAVDVSGLILNLKRVDVQLVDAPVSHVVRPSGE